jgi:hypothetical protein
MTNHNTPQLSRMDLTNHCAAFPGLSALSTTTVQVNEVNEFFFPQAEEVKYVGLHLDRRLTNISSLRGNTLVPYPQNYSGYLDASQGLT